MILVRLARSARTATQVVVVTGPVLAACVQTPVARAAVIAVWAPVAAAMFAVALALTVLAGRLEA